MRKLSLLLFVGLASCAAPLADTPAPGAGPISSGTGLVAKIVTSAQNGCSYAFARSTVQAVLAKVLAGAAGVNTASAAAVSNATVGALCAAVAPLASGPGLEGVTPGYAYGVRVEGRAVVGRR